SSMPVALPNSPLMLLLTSSRLTPEPDTPLLLAASLRVPSESPPYLSWILSPEPAGRGRRTPVANAASTLQAANHVSTRDIIDGAATRQVPNTDSGSAALLLAEAKSHTHPPAHTPTAASSTVSVGTSPLDSAS